VILFWIGPGPRLVKVPNGPGPVSDWSGISGLSPDLSRFSMVPAWLVKVQNGSDPYWSGVRKVRNGLMTLTFPISLALIG
jgi:hypothetical protein